MKKILFVIILLCVFLPMKAYAYSDSFYEGEYIPDAYIKKFNGNKGKYEQMRVLRRNGDNRVVYCLQLWESMKSNTMNGYIIWPRTFGSYDSWIWAKIVLISYYGYGYQNHNSLNWYAATQFMIWELMSPDSTIYFTDKLNGNKTVKFQNEMDEINNLVNAHSIEPTFKHDTNILYNKDYSYVDLNNVLDKYEIGSGYNIKASKDNNVLKLCSTNKSYTAFKLFKKDKLYKNDPVVYENDGSQDLLLPGSFREVIATYYFNIKTTDVTINKKDFDTKESVPSGLASFKDTTFNLYDEKHNLIATEKVNDEGQAIFKNIGYGKYYLKEIKSGDGYKLNNREVEINVNENNIFDVYNEVIKNKIKINKSLKNLDGTILKESASFEVYNSNEEKVLSFNTEDGSYEFDLPYGNYVLKQISGKENYKYVDDINIKVEEDGIIQKYDLYDEQIEKIEEIGDITDPILETHEFVEVIEDVPDTYKKTGINIIQILMINLGLLYFKGRKYV